MKKGNLKKLSKHVKKITNRVSKLYRTNPKALYNHRQIAARLEITDAVEKQILIAVIESMIKDGLIAEEQRGKYRWSGPSQELEGIISFNRNGLGFVEVNGFDRDVLIPEQHTGASLHGDFVQIRLLSGKQGSGRPKGVVINIVERASETFPAVLFEYGHRIFAIPDNQKINVDFLIPNENLNGAKVGQKVVVRLESWQNPKSNPVGSIDEVLGMPGEMRAEGDAILAQFGFPLRFPDEVEKACESLDLSISKEEVEKRKDLRDILTFTIDPDDAKDFDDAISFRTLENGNYEVGVHIADVTHYVKEDSTIEAEAQKRATSVYLVDRVIPMLPEVLSNNVCSLRPKEDKLTFSCLFEVNDIAQVKNTWIGRTVIHSDHRFTYEDAQKILEAEKGLHSEALLRVNALAKTMRKRRLGKGSIAFEKTEVRFRLDEERKPSEVLFKVQKDAHKLIEEWMLLANQAVAVRIGKKKSNQDNVKTFVYRIHDRPDPLKLEEFRSFIKRFGYEADFSKPDRIAPSINAILKEIKGKPEQNIVEMLAIRSMAKAEYSTGNIGHFGLGFDYYSHFTSPIRRYPDMMAHRMLDRYLKGGESVKEASVDRLCKHSSLMERKASEAERASTKLYQVLYMEDYVGEVFDGVISGVTEWGLFVEIKENKCEGMVRLRDIPGDYYFYDQQNMSIIGERTNRVFTLGDSVKIRVENADVINRSIDLRIAER